jgi:hypothetical protein
MAQSEEVLLSKLSETNQCRVREIQAAIARHNSGPINYQSNPMRSDVNSIIHDAKSLTRLTDTDDAVQAYYTMINRWKLIEVPQCNKSNTSPAR